MYRAKTYKKIFFSFNFFFPKQHDDVERQSRALQALAAVSVFISMCTARDYWCGHNTFACSFYLNSPSCELVTSRSHTATRGVSAKSTFWRYFAVAEREIGRFRGTRGGISRHFEGASGSLNFVERVLRRFQLSRHRPAVIYAAVPWKHL